MRASCVPARLVRLLRLLALLIAAPVASAAQELVDPRQLEEGQPQNATAAREQPAPAATPAASDNARRNALSSRVQMCATVAAVAEANQLPIAFFTRLIWQESRFEPRALSRAGAQGVAQFMPRTAAWRGLADPFDPLQALPQSAAFLRELRDQFGNLGLAAAAYNSGPGRVQAWLAGRAGLPSETRAYVKIITGHSAEQWRSGQLAELPAPPEIGCDRLVNALDIAAAKAALQAATPSRAAASLPPWGVQVAGNWSEGRALETYEMLRKRYPALLGGRDPLLLHSRLPGRGTASFTRVRVGADSRASAEKLCSSLRSAGAACLVLRN